MPRQPLTSIYIVCEGKNTEPIYFERIKEEIEDDNFLAITIYPDRSDEYNKTDPIGLIKEAINNESIYDEVWVVYDKDGYTKHKEAFELWQKHKPKIRLIFSSISFETWILMHFEKCSTAFAKSKEIIEQKFLSGPSYLPNYEKKGSFDIYPSIKANTKQALINSAWLRYIQNKISNSDQIYNINPFTNVDILVRRLIENNVLYHFVDKESFKLVDSLEIKLLEADRSHKLIVVNRKAISFTTNELELYSTKKGSLLHCDTVVLEPSEFFEFDFKNDNSINLTVRNNVIFFCF